MAISTLLSKLWEGIRTYLGVRPDVFIFAGAFVLGFIFCLLALSLTGSKHRRARPAAAPWMVLAGLCAFGPMLLGLYRFWRAHSSITRLSSIMPTEPSIRLVIVAPLIIAGLILFINGILYLIALGRYSKLPKSLPADQTAQAQSRPGSAGPLVTGLVIFLMLFMAAGALVGIQVFKANQALSGQAQASEEKTAPTAPQGQPEASANIPDQGVEGGVEGEVPGGVLGGQPGEAPTGDEETYLRITGNPPRLIKEVPAAYPEIAQTARVQGVVILEAKVNAEGKVEEVKVLHSIPLLDQAAMDAVRQWEYEPYLVDGQPKPFILTVTVSFSLT